MAHFVGLHGLQAVPLLGLAISRFCPPWLPTPDRSRLVAIAGVAWLGLTLLLTWQALRGQPLIAPDAMTLAALAGLVATAAAAGALVVALARRRAQ